MADLLVVNHGTTADQNTPNNVLSILSRANNDNINPVLLDTPGFASPAFNQKWLETHVNIGGLSLVRAKPFTETVAREWFDHQLRNDCMMKLPLTHTTNPWSVVDNVIFVGWSRGCITTWYQIFYLLQDQNFLASRPNIRIFNIDPCFGPSNWKSDIRTAMNYLGRDDIIEEAYALNESGVNVVPGVFALYPYSREPCTRHFLPGKHATGAEVGGGEYGENTGQLYTQRLRDFLAIHAPGTILIGVPGAGHRLSIYNEFKAWYMAKGKTKYKFNRAQRKDLWRLNDNRKTIEGIGKTYFFMNREEYFAYNQWPDLKNLLRRTQIKPLVHSVRRDYNDLDAFTEQVVRDWIRRIPKRSGYGRYLGEYAEVFR